MLFAFPPPNRTLDLIRQLSAQLADLGHEVVTADDWQPPPAVNIIGEGFTQPGVDDLKMRAAAGMRFVILVTEMATCVTEHGLLWNRSVSDEYWRERAYWFPFAAALADACWCLVPGTAVSVARWCHISHDIDLGYSRQLISRDSVTPDVDFCFFGSLTDYRRDVVSRLRRAGRTVATKWRDEPDAGSLRDQVVLRARAALELPQSSGWPVISTSRVSTALHLGRPVVGLRRAPGCAQRAWEGVGRYAALADFDEVAASVASSWKSEHARQLKALKALPSAKLLADAVASLPAARPVPVALNAPRPLPQPTIPRPVLAEAPVQSSEPWPRSVQMINGRVNGHDIDRPRLIATHNKHNVIRWKGRIYSVPQSLGEVELDKVDLSRFPSIRTFG